MNSTKKYILKPGRHQFAPKSHAIHHHDNLSDEEAEWYLEKFPHIASLFDTIPEITDPACRVSDEGSIGETTNLQSLESSSQSVKSQKKQYENLPSTN